MYTKHKSTIIPASLWEAEIEPNEITICKRSDGTDWLLGEGSCGQVGY